MLGIVCAIGKELISTAAFNLKQHPKYISSHSATIILMLKDLVKLSTTKPCGLDSAYANVEGKLDMTSLRSR